MTALPFLFFLWTVERARGGRSSGACAGAWGRALGAEVVGGSVLPFLPHFPRVLLSVFLFRALAFPLPSAMDAGGRAHILAAMLHTPARDLAPELRLDPLYLYP